MQQPPTFLTTLARNLVRLSPPFHLRHWKWVRLAILLAVDLAILCLSYAASYWLRFDGAPPDLYLGVLLRTLPLLLAVQIPIFFWGGLYRQMWRYANYHTALFVLKSTFFGSVAFLVACQGLFHSLPPPRSVFIIHWILSTLVIAASRFSWRTWISLRNLVTAQEKELCFIYGAGSGGDLIARHVAGNPKFPFRIVGFIDDDRNKRGRAIHGFRVLGTGADLPQLAQHHEVATVILAMPSVGGARIREAVASCQGAQVKPLIMPDITESLGFDVFQPRAVDTRDLLKRAPKSIDHARVQGFFRGKTLLVTGAGGSIGSEICRQVIRYKPSKLVLLELSEFNLYKIESELRDAGLGEVELVCVLGSAANGRLVDGLFRDYRPTVVLHAAACKHVPIIESNPGEGIRNNILGTRVVAEAAAKYGAERFLLISTDKAVRPTSVMGATKRCGELIVQSLNSLSSNTCGFSAVRFGNVLGSSGSVIPRFLQQIQAGGPVTVTHPEMTRYFMLTSEAVALVLQSISMSKGGEIFVLDMGEPVRILDMATQLIRLAGKEPGTDIEIVFTGLRPGEKLYEELILEGCEKHTLHEEVFIALPHRVPAEAALNRIQAIVDLALADQDKVAVQELMKFIRQDEFNSLVEQSSTDDFDNSVTPDPQVFH